MLKLQDEAEVDWLQSMNGARERPNMFTLAVRVPRGPVGDADAGDNMEVME